MDSLPTEILERIVRCDSVSHRDLLAFTETCSRFRSIGSSNDIWRVKFHNCFHRLFMKLMPIVQTRQNQIDWKNELKKRFHTGTTVGHEVGAMSPRLFHDSELSFTDFAWFDDLLLQHNPDRSYIHLYVVDSLLDLLTRSGREEDLTTKYYAAKVLSHVQRRLLRCKLRDLWPGLESEEGPHSYEEAMVTVAQWCQPCLDVCPSQVTRSLDHLAEQVLSHLLHTRPDLAIFQHIAAGQADCVTVRLTRLPKMPTELRESLWNPGECKIILEAANHVLFQVEGMGGNSEDYYNPENSYINRVLITGRGIPITLCLLYCCVLRRLGIILHPVNFPGHFLLKWESHPGLSGEDKFTFIDAFERGKELSAVAVRERIPHIVPREESCQTASPGQCARRILGNLISIGASRSNNMRDGNYSLLRSSLELMMIINLTDSTQYAFMLSRIYLQLNINHEEVLSLLSDQRDNPGLSDQVDYLLHQCQMQMAEREREKVPPEPKRRGGTVGEGVTFRVGQVCRHKKYHYTCVIYGWDPVCTASQSWISHMGVDKLDDKDLQPFYNVLVSDGSQRYAAQENLVILARPTTVPHPEVGRYFSSWDPGLGYIPNKELLREYPREDVTSVKQGGATAGNT